VPVYSTITLQLLNVLLRIKRAELSKKENGEKKTSRKITNTPLPQREGPCSSVPFPSHHEPSPSQRYSTTTTQLRLLQLQESISLLGYLPSRARPARRQLRRRGQGTAIGLPRSRRPPPGLRSRGK
jgi:hypothetical protein